MPDSLLEMAETNAALEDIICCAIFYIAESVPEHRLFRDMHSYYRISKSLEADEETRYKASVIYQLIKEAHEDKEERLRGEGRQ